MTAFSATLTNRAPSGTDFVVAGASSRAASWQTAALVGEPRQGKRCASRLSSERGKSASAGGGGTNRAQSAIHVGLCGKTSVHHAAHRRSVQSGTPVATLAWRTVPTVCATKQASSSTASR